MSRQITSEMIKHFLFDEDGTRHTDEEVAGMIVASGEVSMELAKTCVVMATLLLRIQEDGEPILPSDISFQARFGDDSDDDDTEELNLLEYAQFVVTTIHEMGIQLADDEGSNQTFVLESNQLH